MKLVRHVLLKKLGFSETCIKKQNEVFWNKADSLIQRAIKGVGTDSLFPESLNGRMILARLLIESPNVPRLPQSEMTKELRTANLPHRKWMN
jgi:hypothetical protein